MPIQPENKKRYPPNWKDISLAIRRRAGDKCEFCGVKNGSFVWRDKDGTVVYAETTPSMQGETMSMDGYKCTKIVLTVAHMDHVPENCSDKNLKALCQRCHLNYDRDIHNRNRVANRIRNLEAKGQVRLF